MDSSRLAFKEWSAVVEALGRGEQTMILRKGGIAEGRGGFALKAEQFWLFPTAFHAQRSKLKAGQPEDFSSAPPTELRLNYFARVVRAEFLTDWKTVETLDPHHIWSMDTIRDRFDWSKPPGLYWLLVRIHRLVTPIILPLTPDLSGCKSWVELPLSCSAPLAAPVLSDAEFSRRQEELVRLVDPPSPAASHWWDGTVPPVT